MSPFEMTKWKEFATKEGYIPIEIAKQLSIARIRKIIAQNGYKK